MSDYQRPERLYQVAAAVQFSSELHGRQVVGDHLALAGLPLTEKVGVDRAANATTQNITHQSQREAILHSATLDLSPQGLWGLLTT